MDENIQPEPLHSLIDRLIATGDPSTLSDKEAALVGSWLNRTTRHWEGRKNVTKARNRAIGRAKSRAVHVRNVR